MHEVLATNSLREFLEAIRHNGAWHSSVPMTPQEIGHIIGQLCQAVWVHDNEPSTPHAELASRRCSAGYVNVSAVMQHPVITEILAWQAVMRIREKYDGPIDVVVGSANAAITWSYEVAKAFGARHVFTEKIWDPDARDYYVQAWRRFEIGPDEVVLEAEKLTTTFGTSRQVRSAMRKAYDGKFAPRFAPVLLTVVNRSGLVLFEDSPVVSLLDLTFQTWQPESCPLCAQGSRHVKPKALWGALQTA